MLNTDIQIAAINRDSNCSTIPIDTRVLVPETAHAAILAAQVAAIAAEHPLVLAAWHNAFCEPTTAQLIDSLSHATDLPTWNVHRHLAQLDLVPPLALEKTKAAKSKAGDARTDRVIRWLRNQNQYATIAQIKKGTKLTATQVRGIMDFIPSPFKRIRVKQVTSRASMFAYQNRDFVEKEVAV